MNQSNLVLQNGAIPATAMTFTPVRPFGGDSTPAAWAERSSGIPLGYRRVEAGLRRANGSPSTKLSFKITLPKVGIDPVAGPKLITTIIAEVNVTLPDNTVELDRMDAAALLSNMFKDPQVVDYFKTLSPAV